MKSTYEARAIKFARLLAVLFADCVTLYDFMQVVNEYNYNHSRRLTVAHGVSRLAIIRADYVIKFDFYNPDERWRDGKAGNNTSEIAVYNKAVADGMEHLLAKPTVVELNGRQVSIMPRIPHVGDDYNSERWYGDYLTNDEYWWIEENINDTHDNNLGYVNGKPVLIDYAWAVEG